MLILTRRCNETVIIGENTSVTVLGIKGNQVRIGIEAPRDVPVHREEIYKRIRRDELRNGQREADDSSIDHSITSSDYFTEEDRHNR